MLILMVDDTHTKRQQLPILYHNLGAGDSVVCANTRYFYVHNITSL